MLLLNFVRDTSLQFHDFPTLTTHTKRALLLEEEAVGLPFLCFRWGLSRNLDILIGKLFHLVQGICRFSFMHEICVIAQNIFWTLVHIVFISKEPFLANDSYKAGGSQLSEIWDSQLPRAPDELKHSKSLRRSWPVCLPMKHWFNTCKTFAPHQITLLTFLLNWDCLKLNFAFPSQESKLDFLTFCAKVIHQQNLLDEVRRRAVEDAVDRPQESGPHLIHKAHDDTGCWEVVVNELLCTPGPECKHITGDLLVRSTSLCWKSQSVIMCIYTHSINYHRWINGYANDFTKIRFYVESYQHISDFNQ